ncbi:BA75_00599T0 [Komagataella pastoris]|uniref:BA75_00599T0 n=1 Tax=Komagataella pastoris TaxID=4922 RepID=A0A1B2J8N4_PICPA|nr:BA75_00599T0 [Komagataella pastoris]
MPGLADLRLVTDYDASIEDLNRKLMSMLPLTVQKRGVITRVDGSPLLKLRSVRELKGDFVDLQLRIPLCGGRGGFGSKLNTKARKSKGKSNDKLKVVTQHEMKTQKELPLSSLRDKRRQLKARKDKLQRLVDIDVRKLLDNEEHFNFPTLESIIEEVENSVVSVREAVITCNIKTNRSKAKNPDESTTRNYPSEHDPFGDFFDR